MGSSRKKISKTDTLINWDIPVKAVSKTISALIEEVASQAGQKTREDDVIRASCYRKKVDGSIEGSARVENKKIDLKSLGTSKLPEGVDIEDTELIKFPDKDQISPENIVEYTNTNGETFDVDKIRKEMNRSSLLSSIIGLPIPVDLDACSVSDVTSQHPDVLSLKKKLEEAEKREAELKKEKDNIQETLVRVVSIQNHSPSKRKKPTTPDTKKTQILNKIKTQYSLTLLNNGKQRIGLKVYYKSKEVQDILKWGQETLDIPMRGKKRVSLRAIAGRMRTVNKHFGVNKRGRPPTSVPKQKNKEPITKKLDIRDYDEEFSKEDF